jgi:hypothetical protein
MVEEKKEMNDMIEQESEIVKSEEQILWEMQEIKKMFPKANFTVAVKYEELDYEITLEKDIIIKHKFDCFCYDHLEKKKTQFFHIHKNKNEKITNKFVINELIKQGLVLDCHHHYIEGFENKSKNPCQFEIITGS